jgi:carboxylesterase type B
MMPLNHTIVLERLHSSLPDSLLQEYGLAKAQTTYISSIKELIPYLINFKTDELFSMSIYRFIREFSKTDTKVFEYHFDRGNPFNGALKGVAHHAIDIEYVFGNFMEGFPEKRDYQLSETLMRYWIGFSNGKEPWVDAATGQALHIRTDASLAVVPREQITSRRWDGYRELEENWDAVRAIGVQIMSAKISSPESLGN